MVGVQRASVIVCGNLLLLVKKKKKKKMFSAPKHALGVQSGQKILLQAL